MRTPIQEIPLIAPDDIRRFGQQSLDTAKQDLLEHGALPRRCFVFGPGKEGTNIYLLDLAVPPEGLLQIAAATDERLARALTTLRKAGTELGLAEGAVAKHIVNGLARMGLTENELLARFIRRVIVDAGAYAYVHVADAHAVKVENPSDEDLAASCARAGPLSADPRAREVIILNVETRAFQETTVVEYERDADGRVVGFRDPELLSSETGAISGRLANLLQAIPLN